MKKYKFFDEKGEHLHTLDNHPLVGTSSVSSVLAKPLTWWASGLAVAKFGWINRGNAKAGWTPVADRLLKATEGLESVKNMQPEEYLKLLDEAYSAHATKLKTSAQTGTDLHAELERYVKDMMSDNDGQTYDDKILPFIEWVQKNVKRFLWSEMYCSSEKLWVGGISDCGYEKNDGTIGIMDFKSSKEAYLSQFWQCAGYDLQITENGGFDKEGNKIFTLEKPITEYAVFPFGMTKPVPQFYYDMEGGKKAFEAEVLLYNMLNV